MKIGLKRVDLKRLDLIKQFFFRTLPTSVCVGRGSRRGCSACL